MKKSIVHLMAGAARIPAAAALSIVLALGCMPAVALADDGSKTVKDDTETFTEINSTGETGLSVVATGSNAEATVTGNVTDNNNSEAYGVKVSLGDNKSANVTINGSVSATSGNSSASGIWVNADGSSYGDASITVDGSVIAEARGAVAGVKCNGSNRDTAEIAIAGDVTAIGSGDDVIQSNDVHAGVYINAYDVRLVVGGTVSGESGIVTSGSFVDTYNNAKDNPFAPNGPWSSIAVWQIKANDNSKPVAYVPGDDGKIHEDETKILLGMIDYIVKYGDGQKGFFSALSADRELGGVSLGSSEYQTAKSGTALTFSVPDRAGYTLKQVFGLDGGPALTRNADGSYTLIVPDGGGILLRAEWEKVQKDDPDPTEPPEVKPAEEKQPETKAAPAEGEQPETKAASTSASGQSNGTLAATSDQVPASALVLVSVIALACMLAAACARKATGR